MDLHPHVGSPTKPGVVTKEVTCVCTCTGTVVTIAADEEPKFILGQLIMLVVAVLISGLILLTSAFYSLFTN